MLFCAYMLFGILFAVVLVYTVPEIMVDPLDYLFAICSWPVIICAIVGALIYSAWLEITYSLQDRKYPGS